ncbi:MAG: rhamnogalacturonan acetylesterase [Verrucomicrobia bacterium]|nr:rhamnogalacturonan acetylesterase [Verrucomicrobiota bacterium]
MRLPSLLLAALLAVAARADLERTHWRFDLGTLPLSEVYTPARGYGFDLGTQPTPDNQPFYFSVNVPEGNYRVTLTLGDPRTAGDTTVKAESRRLMLEAIVTQPGELVTRTFVVNVRTTALPPPPLNAPGGSSVILDDREEGSLTWDRKLTLEFDGPMPRVGLVEIVPADVPTVFLLGDSTVTDQRGEPGASWGQMLTRFLDPTVAVANHAESGETLKSFLTGLRLAKVLSQLKAGDYVFIQFGHNDEKQQWPQTYAEAHTTYLAYLQAYLAEVRLRGAIPVLVTSVQRRTFDGAGRIRNSHGDYPQVVRELAAAEHVALIDLDRQSTVLYEALGPAKAPLAFGNDGKDPTHHNNYGAYELAKCVAQGIRAAHLPLAAHLAPDFKGFDPAHPDAPETFRLAASPVRSSAPLRGN